MKMQKCLKRLLSFTFALLMVLSCVPAQSLTGIEILPKASAAQWSGGFEYEVIAGEAYITDFNGNSYSASGFDPMNLVIPAKIDGYNVVSISNCAFEYRRFTSIEFPEGLRNIGEWAFGCPGTSETTRLTKINIPKSVTNIGRGAFCDSGLSVDLDLRNVTSIGASAFRSTYITSVTLSKKITKIEDNVFSETPIQAIEIPEGVVSIGFEAFRDCENLTSVSFPSTLISIGESAFRSTAVKGIELPKKLQTISSSAFRGCQNLDTVNIPNSVNYLGQRAFSDSSIKEVTIGTGLKKIGSYDHLYSYGSVFENCSFLETVTFKGSVEDIATASFAGCSSLKSIILPKDLKIIRENMFENCTNLSKVIIPNTVTSIYQSAFRNCNNLTSILIPASVTSISRYWAIGHIDAGINGKMPGFTIYGTKGTAAETYAKDNGFAFVEHQHKTVSETTKATTTKDGSIVSTCTECGEDVSIKKIAKVSRISLSKTAYSYDGKVKTPSVTVKDANGKTLKKGTDYTVTYSAGRTKIGKYTVTVTLKGSNYSGSKTLSFTVGPVKPTSVKAASRTANSVTLTWGKVSGASGYVVYRYSDSTKKYTKVATVKTNKATVNKLKAGTTYKFAVQAYKTSGKETYYGETGALFTTTTNPAAPSIKVTSTAKGKAYISFKKVTGATKYEFYCSTSKSGSYKKLSTSSTAYYTASKLTSGKTYYFKVRAYKTLGKTNYYSSYSAVRSVKVK